MHSSDRANDAGSFTTGFAIGLFAGAAGLYLFGTKDGRKLSKKLSKEWESAREAVAGESGLETSATLRELADQAKTKIMMVLDGMASTSSNKTEKKSKKKTRKTATRSKSKFKGV